jgi:hypothetical protein
MLVYSETVRCCIQESCLLKKFCTLPQNQKDEAEVLMRIVDIMWRDVVDVGDNIKRNCNSYC